MKTPKAKEFNMKYQILIIILAFGTKAQAQLYINGSTLKITSNTSLYTSMEVQNTNSSTISNKGTLTMTQNLENNSSSTISGNGYYNLDGNWTNNGTFNPGTSTLRLSGANHSQITSGGDAFYKIILDKDHGKIITLNDNLTIINDLDFSADNNKILLTNNDLTFENSATVSSFDNNEYLVTNGNGQVLKNSLITFTYPLGYDTTSYNPLTLTESGTVDNLGVRCLEHALDSGSSGAPFTNKVVDASWELTETTAGGSNLTISAQWTASDELTNFDRTYCGLSRYGYNGWDLTVGNTSTASGSNPYTQIRSGIDSMGVFAIGAETLATNALLAVNLLLEGAYSGAGLMNDDLRSGGLVPTNEPYASLGFMHEGFGGNESTASSTLSLTGNDAITDWVLVEVRAGNNHSDILATKSALLQKDGDIVDVDGSSDLSIPGIGAGNYYVAIKHRNHLGVLTANPIALSHSSTSYDFTSSAINAFGGTNGIQDLGGGYFGLFSGDYDVNEQIQNIDITNLLPTLGNSGYQQGDLDMNGQVQNTDLQLKLYPNLGRGQQF